MNLNLYMTARLWTGYGLNSETLNKVELPKKLIYVHVFLISEMLEGVLHK